MSEINWTDIATRCGPSIGSLRRGVLRISNLGFFVLFVPIQERARVERELETAGIAIHGFAVHTIGGGEQDLVAVVKADSEEKLRSIAYDYAVT